MSIVLGYGKAASFSSHSFVFLVNFKKFLFSEPCSMYAQDPKLISFFEAMEHSSSDPAKMMMVSRTTMLSAHMFQAVTDLLTVGAEALARFWPVILSDLFTIMGAGNDALNDTTFKCLLSLLGMYADGCIALLIFIAFTMITKRDIQLLRDTSSTCSPVTSDGRRSRTSNSRKAG